eukprot:CAMPEP_0206142048 /NCGR_PEP_ID=MMETSP1473-20131121/15247_1 /ASSEMBLY_ACC=CAM_ASM_001109 /TAXON_ID=1461547 /ORGANISM="Stichococcus sp, Strain RCC1054" /LENGTH=80 /DNA_ID=CAMNT_0053536865 /DNA_START=576 /DNA_END=813 /DNA_ORIENTATION=+
MTPAASLERSGVPSCVKELNPRVLDKLCEHATSKSTAKPPSVAVSEADVLEFYQRTMAHLSNPITNMADPHVASSCLHLA